MAVIGTKNGYSILRDFPGVQPTVRDEMLLRDKAMSGDLVLSLSRTAATLAATGATGTFTTAFTAYLKDAAGNLHDWFCGYVKCALADNATTGVFSIVGGQATTVYFNGGTTTINITSTTGPFAAGKVLTVKLSRPDLLANPVSTVTFTGTFA